MDIDDALDVLAGYIRAFIVMVRAALFLRPLVLAHIQAKPAFQLSDIGIQVNTTNLTRLESQLKDLSACISSGQSPLLLAIQPRNRRRES